MLLQGRVEGALGRLWRGKEAHVEEGREEEPQESRFLPHHTPVESHLAGQANKCECTRLVGLQEQGMAISGHS